MKVWTYPALLGVVSLVIGIVIFMKPEIVNYVIAAIFFLGGILMIALSISMWNEARKLDKIIQETEKEIEAELKKLEEEAKDGGTGN